MVNKVWIHSIILLAFFEITGGCLNKSINKTDHDLSISISFPSDAPKESYDPLKIHLAPQYIVLENIYSPIVETNTKGEVVPGIAKTFEWVEGNLKLDIRKDLKTVNGTFITINDVVFSLKRAIILNSNTHGNIKKLLCPQKSLKSIKDNCPGLIVDGNSLIIKSGIIKPFLLKMLTAIDFAVIPQNSVDQKTLKILDYKNTSGPYYIESDNGKGIIKLKANKNHYHYSPNMPQVIHFVPNSKNNPSEALTKFSKNQIDLITTVSSVSPEDVLQFSSHLKDKSLHQTLGIRSYSLFFTEKGLRELSRKERFFIGKKVQKEFRKTYGHKPGYQEVDQFILPFGDGSLLKKELSALKKNYKNENSNINKELKISLVRIGEKSRYEALLKNAYQHFDIVEGNNIPAFQNNISYEEMPHMFINGPDTGFLEDISFISYSLNAGYFGLEKEQRKKWLEDYVDIVEKEKRLQLLRELHLNALKEPVIIPILSAPYVALSNSKWVLNLSEFYANNQFWLMRIKR